MFCNVNYEYTQQYLPSKRCRVQRTRSQAGSMDVEIQELQESDFPVAFRVHDYQSVYENAKEDKDFRGEGVYRMFTEEIRTFRDRLFKPVRIRYGAAISTCFMPVKSDYIKNNLVPFPKWFDNEIDFFQEGKSIITDTDEEIIKKMIQQEALKYIICDNKIWEECNEPVYEILTFGLGGNHGGTGFLIRYRKNGYGYGVFNALQREEAIAYGKKTALERGNTNNVEGMAEKNIIEVLMPAMVKISPVKYVFSLIEKTYFDDMKLTYVSVSMKSPVSVDIIKFMVTSDKRFYYAAGVSLDQKEDLEKWFIEQEDKNEKL